jgi:CRP/FNR family transcriptional regulator, cyclic AMP receptor protein
MPARFHHETPQHFPDRGGPVGAFCWRCDYSDGDEPTAMYIVQSGEVELRVGGRCIETVGPDGFFGEMALLDHGPRAATAVAKTECILIPVSERHFTYMVEEAPFFALVVLRTTVARLRRVGFPYSLQGLDQR